MKEKLFTVEEANQRLPLIKKITEDVLVKGKRLKALSLLQTTPLVEREQKELTLQIEHLMDEMEDLGCYFKDWNFEIGLVDFPATIDGEEVFLCWRSDEPKIEWYHTRGEGYASRRKIQ